MKTTLMLGAAILLILASSARAQPQSLKAVIHNGNFNAEEYQKCALVGSLYAEAASFRDSNMSPQQSYMIEQGYADTNYMTKTFIKKAINQVYFDADFANAGGRAFENQMTALCLGPTWKRVYQPLQ